MIKRDGVAIMNARTKNVSIAQETLAVLKEKQYTAPSGNIVDISKDLDFAIQNSILYRSELTEKKYKSITTTIEVTNETTTQAATRLLKEGKTNLVALNFASARNVGGGFLAGAIAQEEDLCRRSGLYLCTKNKPMFYNENILCDNCLYTNNMIYSPDVPFFRDEHLQFLEEPYLMSIISAPAPNLNGAATIDPVALRKVIDYRTYKILQIAEAYQHKNIILGAWGCGAFGNDPSMVATAFVQALLKVPVFEHVCFAVHDKREGKPVYNLFKEMIME
jgi:uncharacterized protein (TIGR02452 family)